MPTVAWVVIGLAAVTCLVFYIAFKSNKKIL
jgi:uncharacterized membrane protein YuzA (DUF378 family)